MNRNTKIIIVGLLFIAGLMIAINLGSTINWSRKIVEKGVEKYKRSQHKNSAFEINPSDVTASYWLEKKSIHWELVVYFKNENLFRTRSLKILKYISLGNIDSTRHNHKLFGKKERNYSYNYYLRTETETLDVFLKPRQEKEYRFEYSDSLWVIVENDKGYTFFGAPLWGYHVMDRCKHIVAMSRKLGKPTMKRTGKYWYSYENWSETMDDFKDLPDGIYWPANGVLAKLDYPAKPIISINDSFSITYYFKIPTIMFKEYEKDTLFLTGAIVHEDSTKSFETKEDHIERTVDIYKADSKNVTYIFDDNIKVKYGEMKTTYTTAMTQKDVRKIAIKVKLRKEDMQNRRCEYKKVGKERVKYNYYQAMWWEFPTKSVRYWFPYMASIGSGNFYSYIESPGNKIIYPLEINSILIVTKLKTGLFSFTF
jgi:hypothetical protein